MRASGISAGIVTPNIFFSLLRSWGLYGPVWLNGVEINHWRMRTGLGHDEQIDSWASPGGAIIDVPDADPLTGPLWLAAKFALPDGFDGAVRLALGEHAGEGSVWLNGLNNHCGCL